jgi:transposase
MTATALVATMGDPKQFKNGRQLSAWLRLVPKQNSSRGKEKLLGISKRGEVYLRTLLIHGARSAVCAAKLKNKGDRKSCWAISLLEKKGVSRASIALANKNTRVIWALLAKGEKYQLKVAA